MRRLGGIVCEFELQKPLQIEKRLEAIIKAYRVKAENGALKQLIEITGTSMQELINELRKQIEYVGEGGTITSKTVDALAIKTFDCNIFDLTDNLRKKEYRKSFTDIK